jgi:membrane glycosyltransferase
MAGAVDEVSRRQASSDGSTPTRRPFNEYALLPAEAPLPMPPQVLHPDTTANVRDRLTAARAILLLVAVGSTAAFILVLYQVLSVVRLTALQGVFLLLCTLCFAWIAFGTTSAVLGFLATLRSRVCSGLQEGVDGALHDRRTALLFPVYNEDPARVAATIEATATELLALGQGSRFDFFVLSDSRTSEAKARELRAVRLLRRALPKDVRIYYRARTANVGKKAGNIADWVERFGAAYDYFIILDADSVMSGGLMVKLVAIMRSNPRTALIQTVPRLIGAKTIFARLQQYAVGFYGPVIAFGPPAFPG